MKNSSWQVETLVYKNGKGAVVVYRGEDEKRAVAVYEESVARHPERPAVVLRSWIVRHERVVKEHKTRPGAKPR
jgi:hypothetical protein